MKKNTDVCWLYEEDSQLVHKYLTAYIKFLNEIPETQRRKECISGLNRLQRMDAWSAKEFDIDARAGDICYIDFGQAFINEAGYQHFGLVIASQNHKLLVIPMTSNKEAVRKALGNDGRYEHLYYIGKISGLNRPSVLFLNDGKYINSSRIISINAHLSPDSQMFKDIILVLYKNLSEEFMLK